MGEHCMITWLPTEAAGQLGPGVAPSRQGGERKSAVGLRVLGALGWLMCCPEWNSQTLQCPTVSADGVPGRSTREAILAGAEHVIHLLTPYVTWTDEMEREYMGDWQGGQASILPDWTAHYGLTLCRN